MSKPTRCNRVEERDPRERTQPALPDNVREPDDCGELSHVGNDAGLSFHWQGRRGCPDPSL